MNAVDLFCGVGVGFAMAELGIDEHGIDNEPTVKETRDRLGWATTCADIRELDPHDWAGVEGLWASPPCQSWSRAGKGAGLDDPRGQLVWQPLVWAQALRPKWVACEQVPEARGAFELIAHRLREIGYHTAVYTLSSETFGVPQTRLRVFLAAHRDRPVDRPVLTHQRYRKGRPRVEPCDMLGHLPWVSMAEALGGCPPWVFGNQDSDLGGGRSERYRRSTDLPCPTISTMGRSWTLRYRRGAGMVERYGERPGRDLDEPAFCLTTGAATGGTKHQWWPAERPSTTVWADPRVSPPVHHNGSQTAGAGDYTDAGTDKPVALTEQQGCTLMGYPPGTAGQLAGNKQDRWRIIGNGVTPPVAQAVLETLVKP
jgi:DNA (cytosine-5)-methyltransferase 1